MRVLVSFGNLYIKNKLRDRYFFVKYIWNYSSIRIILIIFVPQFKSWNY